MYKIFFVNFGYFSANEGASLEDARKICRQAGFQSVVYKDYQPIASWCPMMGWNTHKWTAAA